MNTSWVNNGVLHLIKSRDRHPGQGPRDHAVPVPEILDRDRDSFLKSVTQIQNLRDLGLEQGLKFEKSGIWDWDRDASKNQGPEPGLNFGGLSRGLKFSGTHSRSRADP